jgi:ferric-dicitrate binding protein FerR (iron transport regulator)
MLCLVRSTRYANKTASPRRKRPFREAGSCNDPLRTLQIKLTLRDRRKEDAMTNPRQTPRNNKALALAVLAVVVVSVWLVVFR